MEFSRERLSAISPQFELIHADFKNIKEELAKRGINSVDGILFDLGVSSPQLDNGERGFSYNYDARLDMRMNKDDKLDAYTIVNTYSENDLRKLIFTYRFIATRTQHTNTLLLKHLARLLNLLTALHGTRTSNHQLVRAIATNIRVTYRHTMRIRMIFTR